jgi:hypothetical protein
VISPADRGRLPRRIPRIRRRWSRPYLDDQHRWDTARRLLHDETLKAEDRLAAISHMTTEQIQVNHHEVRLRLGRVPLQLPEPVATLARTVMANRKGHAAIGAVRPSPWLFLEASPAGRSAPHD